MSEENVEAARLGYAAATQGDFAAIAELLAPEVRWHGGDPRARGACGNRDQVLEFMRAAQREGRIGELVDVIEAGDQVVVVMRPPSGDGEEPVLRANLTTFREGKVVEMVAFETPEAALAASHR